MANAIGSATTESSLPAPTALSEQNARAKRIEKTVRNGMWRGICVTAIGVVLCFLITTPFNATIIAAVVIFGLFRLEKQLRSSAIEVEDYRARVLTQIR